MKKNTKIILQYSLIGIIFLLGVSIMPTFRETLQVLLMLLKSVDNNTIKPEYHFMLICLGLWIHLKVFIVVIHFAEFVFKKIGDIKEQKQK